MGVPPGRPRWFHDLANVKRLLALPGALAGDQNPVGDRIECHANQFLAVVAALSFGTAFVEDAAEDDVQADSPAIRDAVLDAIAVVRTGVLGEYERLVRRRLNRQLDSPDGGQGENSQYCTRCEREADETLDSQGCSFQDEAPAGSGRQRRHTNSQYPVLGPPRQAGLLKARRYAVGVVAVIRRKWSRSEAAVPKPQRQATVSTGRSDSSSSRRASSTRWESSHCSGVVPVSSRKRRAKEGGRAPARQELAAPPRGSCRCPAGPGPVAPHQPPRPDRGPLRHNAPAPPRACPPVTCAAL